MTAVADDLRTPLLDSLRAGPVLGALTQRLGEVATALLDTEPSSGPADPAALLPLLIDHCRQRDDLARTWLLAVGVLARWPAGEEVRAIHRWVSHDTPDEALFSLLDLVVRRAERGTPELELDVLVGGVVASVDFCARYDYNSGIQRTVRETVPRWQAAGHEFVLTAYTRTADGLRTLRPNERARVLEYSEEPIAKTDTSPVRLVVPWQGTLVLPEVTVGRICQPLAGAAELSGNRVSCIGYDAIPLVNAQLRRNTDSERFAQYLSVVKHTHRVAGISTSATTEFAGFADMLPAQGLPGPRVTEVVLPAEPPVATPVTGGPRVLPHTPGHVQVLCVGAKETHKNHRAVLHAAERLWREGLRFDLTFVGGRGWTPEQFEAAFDRLEAAGRPIRHLGRLPDEALDRAYREADLTVFLSLQEGYGLPAAEALSCGTPVLTSNFGSLAEIAADGGALLADPRDDDEITAQLRRLIEDPALRERLAEEARRRPVRTWDDYARELWDELVVQA